MCCDAINVYKLLLNDRIYVLGSVKFYYYLETWFLLNRTEGIVPSRNKPTEDM